MLCLKSHYGSGDCHIFFRLWYTLMIYVVWGVYVNLGVYCLQMPKISCFENIGFNADINFLEKKCSCGAHTNSKQKLASPAKSHL